jgi:hypothetical protein
MVYQEILWYGRGALGKAYDGQTAQGMLIRERCVYRQRA